MLIVGNIYELKLSRKIEEYGLLIFNINANVSARLHKRNLSNNIQLNQKMFDLFNVGHEVTVLVTGFNEEKNYFELSTKAFRNSLDDVLSFTRCSQIINDRYNFYNEIHVDHLIQYRKILDRLRGDLASTGLTFLYELLQNAVDHPNKNFKNELSVHFEVFNNYLLLKHNGALFTENNFKSICGILFGEQVKETEANRIGYKGIGFKSVFRHSTNVYVRSGNFSFCFKREIVDDNKPWEVMPKFQNELEKIDEIPQFDFFNSPVAFAFQFTSDNHKNKVIEYLTALSQNPYLLIFLDKLKRLKIITPIEEQTFEKEIISGKNGYNTIKLKINEIHYSEWSSFSNTFIIEEQNIISELLDENNKSIPEHFRQFRSPKIDVIIPVQKTDNPINLFAYLPLSSTKFQLDYIVNADFIPNLDRSNIINLSYNFKLAEFAAIQIIKACESFALNKEYKKIKQLFPIFETGINEFKDKLQLSFINKIENSKIFPSYYDGKLHPIAQILIDDTGLYKIIPESLYSQLTSTDRKPLDLNSELEGEYLFLHDKLSIGHTFKKDDLVSSLNTKNFETWLKKPENNFLIVSHFNSSNDLKDLLKTENIILNSNNELKNSTSLYKDIPKELLFLGLNVINSELLKLLDEKVISFEFLEFELIKFYKENVLGKEKEINLLLKSEETLLNFWRFIYNCQSLLDNEEILKSLRTINVLCKSNTVDDIQSAPIGKTLLPKDYDTESEMEGFFKSINSEKNPYFISEKYIDSNRKPVDWKKVFAKIKIKKSILEYIPDIISNIASFDETAHFQLTKHIFEYWKKMKEKNELPFTEEQIKLLKSHLKFKNVDSNKYETASKCFISFYYCNNIELDNILKPIKLPNLVSSEYGTDIINWKLFFDFLEIPALLDKQSVFNAKIELFIAAQDNLQEKHFEILKCISDLYKGRKENGLDFGLENILAQLKLKTTRNNEWHLPNNIHLSDIYSPKLKLQNDETINPTLLFLNEKYLPDDIHKYFLIDIGVNDSFKFYTSELKRNEIPTSYRQKFESLSKYIVQNATQYASQHRLQSHIDLNYKYLLIEIKYSEIFWEEVQKSNSKHIKYLFQESTYKTAFNFVSFENYAVNYIKHNATFPNQEDELKKPTELYSFYISNYILEKSYLPKYDLSGIHFNNEQSKSLEDILGFQNLLSQNHCIVLLCRSENSLTDDEVTKLQIVKILSDYTPSNDEKEKLFLPNKDFEWKSLNNLFISTEEEFPIEPSQHLHEDFIPIANNFGIQKLSEDDLVLKTQPLTPTVTDEIEVFFRSKLKYIAFKIDNSNYDEVEMDIIQKITSYAFYAVSRIEKVFKEDIKYNYSKPFDFYIENNKLYFIGNWKFNTELIDWMLEYIFNNKIQKGFFQSILTKSESEIKEALKFEFESIPGSWSEITQKETESENILFLNEIYSFIENDYSESEVAELKQLLMGFKDGSKNRTYLLNSIAKLKLIKEKSSKPLSIEELKKWDFHELEINNEKYLVHSARSSFAYISPSDIIKMKEENYFMALDFGMKRGMKIIKDYEIILKLNRNKILFFKGDKTINELYNMCISNNKAGVHFLMIDRENELNDNNVLNKLLNGNEDYS